MAFIYLVAFWSLGVQVLGLIGSHGILPVGDFLHYVAQQEGVRRWWVVPTLCWINSSDAFLLFLCWGGVLLSVLLMIGVMPLVTASLLWLFYLSLTGVGQDFLSFQWDNLLLETGLLLIFLMPQSLAHQFKPSFRPSVIVIWLLRWLLFRLMLESGLVKLLSGDTNWSHLTALTFHYWTQPLPNMFSWYANQLPLWFQKASCLMVFIIELGVPFLIFAGRWGRLIAFFAIAGLQAIIILTGNFCFFNLLTVGLCFTLLEDEHFQFLPIPKAETIGEGGLAHKISTSVLAVFILTVSLGLIADSFLHLPLLKPIEGLITWSSPLRSINNYGLFAVMTTERNEIILEGSNDGDHWKAYEFYDKPGDINQPPRWAMPHQPRLDWQMWFAALGTWRENQWLVAFMAKLLQGDKDVEHLLAVNPFPDHPPKYIQASYWSYHFTDFKQKGWRGPWWHREVKGLYCPTVSLSNG